MTVNVYDYYHHRFALEEARREARSRDRFWPALLRLRHQVLQGLLGLAVPAAGSAIGVALALLLAFLAPGRHPAPLGPLAVLGAAWGFVLGALVAALVEWLRKRTRLVRAALRGEPLGRHGARQLAARRR